MFIALLINPFISIYHIIIHAVFKSLLFLLSGSLIHYQYNYQSIYKLKIKHTLIKTILLLSSSVLIMALSKEAIIYSSSSIFNSSFIIMIIILGTLFTILYTFNIYLSCFHYSLLFFIFSYSTVSYSFLLLFLVLSSLFIDIIIEYNITLTTGTLFVTVNYGTFIEYLIIDEHFSIAICIIIFILSLLSFHSLFSFIFILTTSILSYSSSLLVPYYQDLFILYSSTFIRGPINLLEVISSLNHSYNLYYIHYYNYLFIILLFYIIIII